MSDDYKEYAKMLDEAAGETREKRYTKRQWAAGIILFTLAVVMIFLITVFAIGMIWAWIVPDLFPGAVEDGLVAGSLTMWESFKILFVLLIGPTLKTLRRMF